MQRPSNLINAAGVLALLIASVLGTSRVAAQEAHAPVEATPHSATSASGEGHASEDSNPLKPEPRLAIWTLVVFIGLLLILGRFAWKPLLHALHEREKHLEHVLLETERSRNESERLLSEHRKQMARAADDVRALMDKARDDAMVTSERMIEAAQAEAETSRQRAQREIASARDQALAEIWQKTADMAVSVAGRVLSKDLSEGEHKRLLDLAIRELPQPSGSNGHGGKTG